MTSNESAPFRPALRPLVPLLMLASCTPSHDIATNGPLTVADAWVRVTSATQSGAMYMTLENRDTGTVTIVSAGSFQARAAELHESMQRENMAHMAQLDSLPIAPGATLTMQPGGMHIMLIDLTREMAPGDSMQLALHHADGRTTSVLAVVRPEQQ